MAGSRVEWTRLSGEEAETILAVLLYRERPRAVRVRPSSGDGGVDVLVPNPEFPGRVDVYQIKKFAQNLTARRKAQIDGSYQRLVARIAVAGTPVANWYLVMPLDPTPENLSWFHRLPERAVYGLSAPAKKRATTTAAAISSNQLDRVRQWHDDPVFVREWKGLMACDGLAAKYPDVIDYYLQGGRERVESAVAQVAVLLRTDRSLRDPEGLALQPADLREHLLTVQSALDADPFYRYGISLGLAAPSLRDEPGLVAASQEITEDGTSLTFRIYARFHEAVNERPIPLRLQFIVQPDSDDHEALLLWQKYGKPMALPAAFTADLPGGLGTTDSQGRVTIGPTAENVSYRMRYQLAGPDGTVLSELAMDMDPASIAPDGKGGYARGRDSTGAVEFELLTDFTTRHATLNAKVRTDLTGAPVTEALTALRFLSHWTAGNHLLIAAAQGPFQPLITLSDEVRAPVDPLLVTVLEALVTIQERSSDVIAVPDFGVVNGPQVKDILEAAALIRGQTLLGVWAEANVAYLTDTAQFGVEAEALIRRDLHVQIGDQAVFVGVTTTHLDSAVLEPVRRERPGTDASRSRAPGLGGGRVPEDAAGGSTTGEPADGSSPARPVAVLRPVSSDSSQTVLDINARPLPAAQPNIQVRVLNRA